MKPPQQPAGRKYSSHSKVSLNLLPGLPNQAGFKPLCLQIYL